MHQNSAEGHHMGNFPPTNFLSFFGPLILVWIGGAPLLVLASIALCTCMMAPQNSPISNIHVYKSTLINLFSIISNWAKTKLNSNLS